MGATARTGGLAILAILAAVVAGATAAVSAVGPLAGTEAAVVEEPVAAAASGSLVSCEADAQACELAGRMLEGFPYPWLTLGYDVVVAEGDGRWLSGLADPNTETITLFVRDGTTEEALAATFAHEVGHALHQVCEDRVLDTWRERRGLSDRIPLFVEPPHEYDSVAEDFAEAFREFLGFGRSMSSVGPPKTTIWLQRNADVFVPFLCPEE